MLITSRPHGIRCFFHSILISLVFFFLNCAQQHDNETEFLPLKFNVDTNLIASPVAIANSFFFYPPKDWEPIATDQLIAAQKAMSSDSNSSLSINLLQIFKSEKNASCVISEIKSDTTLSRFLSDNFHKMLSQNFNSNNVEKGTYILNGKKIVQYRILTKDIIAFKLFAEFEKSIFQIDYFIPSQIYPSEINKIESSIGSISITNLEKE